MCSIISHQGLRISCTSKKERFGANWHVLHEENIEKDSMEIKYWIHQCKGFLTQILTLIRPIHIQDAKPNHKNLEAAPKPEHKLGIFCEKIEN